MPRALSGQDCAACERRVADDADPARARGRAAAKEEARAAARRQEGLFPAESAV